LRRFSQLAFYWLRLNSVSYVPRSPRFRRVLQSYIQIVLESATDTAEGKELPLTLQMLTGERTGEIFAAFRLLQRSFCLHFGDILKLSECAEGTIIDSRAHRSFVQDVPAFMEEERAKFDRQIWRSRKHREAFERELDLCPGPSSPSEPVQLRFKAVNRISRNGRRVLMFINHKFHDGMDASRHRDAGRRGPTTHPDFFHLKPGNSVVPNSSAIFQVRP
jgi:hypothetical protein